MSIFSADTDTKRDNLRQAYKAAFAITADTSDSAEKYEQRYDEQVAANAAVNAAKAELPWHKRIDMEILEDFWPTDDTAEA